MSHMSHMTRPVMWMCPSFDMEGRRPYRPLVFCVALLAKAEAFVCPNPALSSSPSSPQRCESELRQNAASGTMSSPFQALTKAVGGAEDVRVTFLESNSWMWQVAGVNLLVDPVMYTLDFGVPSLIQGKKNVVNGDASLKQLAPEVDWVLISQGFDDHCHPATLEKAVKLLGPGVKFVAPPSARGVLEQYFPASRVVYLSPGQSTAIGKKGNSKATITVVATTGDTLGPPWQAPENGYVLQFEGKKYRSLYYEPHCRFDVDEFEKLGLTADVLVTPIIKQQLLGLYPLVNGQAKAVELARALKAKVVVPMNNGELDLSDSSWAFKNLVKKVGTLGEFKRLLEEGLPGTAVTEAPPGVSVVV